MTAVTFHFNAPDPLHYACRLLRKALRGGSRLIVTASAHRLAELDRMLWTFEPLEFVPHWRGPDKAALPAGLTRTPILLLEQLDEPGEHTVLVNLGENVPEGHERFDRVVEIVGREDALRQAARQRWRAYAAQGLKVEAHEVPA